MSNKKRIQTLNDEIIVNSTSLSRKKHRNKFHSNLIQNVPVNREARRRIKAAEKKTGIFFDF